MSINNEKKIALRKQAHHINPIIFIGHRGLTNSLLTETDRALTKHRLIKIKILGQSSNNCLLLEICQYLKATPIQKIGKILIIWRDTENKIATSPIIEKKLRIKGTKTTHQFSKKHLQKS